ncbi:MAG: PSD1 and planctomycete cytochrome C domain-containing protein [Planctomycetota bacterium]|nr:PSD1 and planctomycete cytochrome C domain-containing protein [Planctomycetota bacterium]
MRQSTPWLFAITLLSTPLFADDQDDARRDFFEKKIRPVLVAQCYECHAATSKSVKGKLRLDNRATTLAGGESGEAVVPGKPDESLLLAALKFDGLEMPPKGKLSDAIIADFETWIRNGAFDPRDGSVGVASSGIDYEKAGKFWAFQKPRQPAIPQPKNTKWARNEIDAFVLARLEANGLQPSSPVARRALIRRAYFGLIGVPPSIEEAEQFVKDDSPGAFTAVIDRLLESSHYGERWGRHWLDVARYGEDQAHTFKARNYPRGYFYRDWVVESLNQDMPYDEFLRQQIAGDLLEGEKRHEQIAALGLFALGPVYYAENVEKAKAAADEWDDRIDTLTRGVLGLTVSCARCHDHKYDPISMQDYYGLAGVFASSEYQERPIVSADVVQQRSHADDAVKQRQLEIDRFLVTEARALRPSLLPDVPKFMLAAWKVSNRLKTNKDAKKVFAEVAKSEKLNQDLLKRWVGYLKPSKDASQRPYLAAWFQLVAAQDKKRDLSGDKPAIAAMTQAAAAFRTFAESKVARKDNLFKRFGDNVAFVSVADKSKVEPGVIPLGNLFDDSANVSLDSALSTDRFGHAASAASLGVDRVVQGWGTTTKIAPDVDFNFAKLGSDGSKYGSVVNDAWQPGAAIQTQGKQQSSNRRIEQGIGMHANALITFDLDAIRKAGLLPPDQQFFFKVDRAGLNDDVFGSGSPSAHLAVIVSKPHKDKAVSDAIIAGFVNGKSVDVEVDDFTYYFLGEIPKPLKADGKYADFSIPIPADAKHITLVATGADKGDGNSINSDHTVFSGARLELNPLPITEAVAETDPVNPADKQNEMQDRQDAILLSQLFYDDGLLALPAKESESRLSAAPKKALAELKKQLADENAAAGKIQIVMAHALRDAKSTDLPIYLAGNPEKKGDVAQRAMPAIFTGGKKAPFQSKGSGRLELARAITSPDNSLTARVIVNRVWAGHFGHGLVRTPSNFGNLGERPSHPELLDHLAVWFVKHDWSLKKLHRLILQSATYQQASDFDSVKFEADPENRLLWRMNRRRLEIEPWRDGMLAVSGELDETLGGPSKNLGDANNKRRTLYGFVSRHRLDELLRLFDFPDPNITADRRTTTTVPLQQLFVMNSDFMINRARALAKRLTDRSGMDDAERIEHAFQLVFGRSARPDEVSLAVQFLKAETDTQNADKVSRLEQYALALLSSNEFMFVD